MSLAPIALFTYNRLEHLQKTIGALKNNPPAKDSELFIFSDGPKSNIDTSKVEEVRNFIKTINGFKSIKTIERSENYGLAKSIITGVTEIINNFGKVVVIEDDLVTSPHFLKYMNDGLDLYEHADPVISIHGYAYPIADTLPETFFIKGADCWGWATWKRGWDLFNPNGQELLDKIRSRKLEREFNFDDTYPYLSMLAGQISGKNNSWAIRWYASAFLNDKLTLYPRRSLVKNIGFDGTGENSGMSNTFDSPLSIDPITVEGIPVKESLVAKKELINFFRTLRPNKFNRVIAKIKKIFK